MQAAGTVNAHFAEKQQFFDHGHSRSYGFRLAQLKILKKAVDTYEDQICEATKTDLNKSSTETFMTEIGVVKSEIEHAMSNLREWMRPEQRPTPLSLHPSSSRIVYEPKGVVLIIGSFNFPFQLNIMPLIGAIAAGNCAVVKPSELAPATAKVIERMLSDFFAVSYISTVQGEGHKVVPELLESHDFHHVFFTGSPAVGSSIAVQASRKLIPFTLELGGKSPGIVDASAKLKVAAKRLVLAKFLNAGQTCVAPDYLLVHESVKEAFVKEVMSTLKKFYGKDPASSKDYGRIINVRHFERIKAYLDEGRIIHGGQYDADTRYIAPTLMEDVPRDASMMREEIFGPIWPIFTWKEREEILEYTRLNRYPLACYIFTSSKAMEKYIVDSVEFGGGCINNALLHVGNHDLPFGGVQSSGQGNYHGWHSFAAFSHAKGVMKTATWFDIWLKYPPFSKFKLSWLKRLM